MLVNSRWSVQKDDSTAQLQTTPTDLLEVSSLRGRQPVAVADANVGAIRPAFARKAERVLVGAAVRRAAGVDPEVGTARAMQGRQPANVGSPASTFGEALLGGRFFFR